MDSSAPELALCGLSHHTAPVDSYEPNPWGFYAVHGNVFEWVEDCFADTLAAIPANGRALAALDCKFRSIRGGAWHSSATYLRAAYRGHAGAPANPVNVIGFRVARDLAE